MSRAMNHARAARMARAREARYSREVQFERITVEQRATIRRLERAMDELPRDLTGMDRVAAAELINELERRADA